MQAGAMSQPTGHRCPQCFGQVLQFAPPRKTSQAIYSVWTCEQCGLGTTVPQPDAAVMRELHSPQRYRNSMGERFIKPVEWLVEGMRLWRIRRLAGHVKTGRALDVGCGSGRFLRSLRNAGWDVAGVELDDETAAGARAAHGLAVETTLDAFSDRSFDLITITHVLEHVRDPRRMLAHCLRLLRPGGIIAVAVPNLDSWQAQLTRGHWFHLDLPRHLWHFSETWLSRALCDLDLTQVAVRRLDFVQNILGWSQSLLNLMGLYHNRLYSFFSADNLAKTARPHYMSLFLSLALLPGLLPLSILLSVLEAVSRAGGTVEIIARFPEKACPAVKGRGECR